MTPIQSGETNIETPRQEPSRRAVLPPMIAAIVIASGLILAALGALRWSQSSDMSRQFANSPGCTGNPKPDITSEPCRIYPATICYKETSLTLAGERRYALDVFTKPQPHALYLGVMVPQRVYAAIPGGTLVQAKTWDATVVAVHFNGVWSATADDPRQMVRASIIVVQRGMIVLAIGLAVWVYLDRRTRRKG